MVQKSTARWRGTLSTESANSVLGQIRGRPSLHALSVVWGLNGTLVML